MIIYRARGFEVTLDWPWSYQGFAGWLSMKGYYFNKGVRAEFITLLGLQVWWTRKYGS